jgi:hypothetical protein
VSKSSRAKPTPMEAFEDNLADARCLLQRVDGFTNRRRTRMRQELRERVGAALRVPVRDRANLDCLESDDVFLVFKHGSSLTRADFLDHDPLLRQALVAGCAAFETYVADWVMARVGSQLISGELTARAAEIPMTLGTWMEIHERYTQKKRGLRKNVIEPFVYERASTSPKPLGELMSLIGVRDWSRTVDKARGCKRGTTVEDLDRISKRRNRIAHQGDRDGRGRANISLAHVRGELDVLQNIARAMDDL